MEEAIDTGFVTRIIFETLQQWLRYSHTGKRCASQIVAETLYMKQCKIQYSAIMKPLVRGGQI